MKKFEPNRDCFAYCCSRPPECLALKKLYCRTEDCHFYKSKEQHKEEMEKYPMIRREDE